MAIRIRHNSWSVTLDPAVARYVVLILITGAFCLGFLTGRVDGPTFITVAVSVLGAFGFMSGGFKPDTPNRTPPRKRVPSPVRIEPKDPNPH